MQPDIPLELDDVHSDGGMAEWMARVGGEGESEQCLI
jgi:hypothetical protein